MGPNQSATSIRFEEAASVDVPVEKLADGTTDVNLSGKCLIKIPEEALLKWEAVGALDLSRNPGICLHGALSRFKNARKLSLNACNLNSIPDDISGITLLEELDLDHNQFLHCPRPALGLPLRLKKLSLRECKLSAFPDWLGELQMLEELVLDQNQLSQCPRPELGLLRRLKKLSLKGCCLTDIPDWFGELQMLEELYLDSNGLSVEFRREYFLPYQLKKLTLRGCRIFQFPHWLGKLEMLEELDLDGNELFRCCRIPLGLPRRLKKLSIRGCSLPEDPDWLGELEMIEELYLSRMLPLSIHHDIEASRMTSPGSLEKLLRGNYAMNSGLIKAGQRLNSIQTRNFTLGKLRQLQKLELKDWGFKAVPQCLGDLEVLEELDLGWNNFSNGLDSSLCRLKRLKKLELEHCKIKAVPDWFNNLEMLSCLNLAYNDLEEYPACLHRMKNLEQLNVSNTFIAYYKLARYRVKGEGNRIKKLPFELAFTTLSELKLEGNPITEPPAAIWTQGLDAIRSFTRGLIPGGVLQRSDTVNMLGDVGAGKTSLAQSLVARSPCPTEEANRTHVMQQLRMTVDEASGHSVNINDFGGHEIYHSVMRIFLPDSGLLALVIDLTKDMQSLQQSIRKWLLTAISKCQEIRMVIVGTHVDKLRNLSERSNLQARILAFSLEIMHTAIEEVSCHISRIESQQNGINMHMKLTKLCSILSNLKSATIRVVTLSCSVPDEGLQSLLDLVIKMLQRPECFPFAWFRVINEILKLNPSGYYITMSEVQNIAKAHLTDDVDDQALKTILHYLAKTSQILWVHDHPRLQHVIFHSPQKIIDTCKKILHHDSQSLPALYKDQLEEYEKGIVREPLLRELLKKHTVCLDRYPEQTPATALPFDVAVDFLEKFNLINHFDASSEGRIFLIPCKLTSDEPSEYEKFKHAAENCLNRVTMCVSFIGSVVPTSFFETSLSAMLTIARTLIPSVIRPWKLGLIVIYGGVYFLANLSADSITLTAFSETCAASPWIVLQPMLRCFNEHSVMWHGAPPNCSVKCPVCVRGCQPNNRQLKIGEIETDLPQLAGLERQDDTVPPTCPTCLQCIPQSLCFPVASHGSFTEEQRKIEEFFKSIDRAALLGASHLTRNDARPSRDWDCMDNERLRENLRRNYSELVNKLSREEANGAASILFSCGMLLKAELEQVHLEGKTPTEAAQTLIDYVGKKDTKEIYCAFLEILHSQLKRVDLVKVLTALEP